MSSLIARFTATLCPLVLTLAALAPATGCDDPDAEVDADELDDDDEVTPRGFNLTPTGPPTFDPSVLQFAFPATVELSSIPWYQNIWLDLPGSHILVFDDGANTSKVYAFQVYYGEVRAVVHAGKYADLLRSQDFDLTVFPGHQWVTAEPDRDKFLIEASVDRKWIGPNFILPPPKPIGPVGDGDPYFEAKIAAFVPIAVAGG